MMEAGCVIGATAPNSPAATTTASSSSTTVLDRLCDFWNERIMERFIKANLFLICCIAAALLLIGYLAAFSCEVSWILEARGDLPNSAYVLCTQYFIVFVATTILIHGLVTGLPWGLFAWSVIIGILSIPELFFVMVMTTQHWGLQSVHGLTELISYLIRLVINCFALICVIPTGLKWRREQQVLSQLQNLATRLQLQTPPPSVPIAKGDSRRASKRSLNIPNITSFDNGGYVVNEVKPIHGSVQQFFHTNSTFGSQNEFNASHFAPTQQYSAPVRGNRAQSLMDLRCTLPGLYNPRYVIENEDQNAKYFNITVDDLKNNLNDSKKPPIDEQNSIIGSVAADPIYCTIDAAKSQQQKLSRNCVSLENLEGIAKVQHDLSYDNNLLQNYEQQYILAMMGHSVNYNPLQHQALLEHLHRHHHNNPRYSRSSRRSSTSQRHNNMNGMVGCGGIGYGGYTNPFAYNAPGNSKLSLGNESDDYRKYRDVAL